MNEAIKNHVTAINQKKGWGTTDKDLFETIREMGKKVYEQNMGSHRWYDKMFTVVELDGMFIGYDDFHTTGDSNAYDLGLEHDIRTICQVVKKQKTVDYFEKV